MISNNDHNSHNTLPPGISMILCFATILTAYADQIVKFDAEILMPLVHTLAIITSYIVIDSSLFDKWFVRTITAICKRLIVWLKYLIELIPLICKRLVIWLKCLIELLKDVIIKLKPGKK